MRRSNPRPSRPQHPRRRPRRRRSRPGGRRRAGRSRAPTPRRSHAPSSPDRAVSLNTELIWILARSTGTASLVALTLSLLTGMALRPKTLGWLSTNRAVSELHSYATVLWLPLGLAHVLAILLDPYSKVGLLDLVVPFLMPYGTFAIGLGTL